MVANRSQPEKSACIGMGKLLLLMPGWLKQWILRLGECVDSYDPTSNKNIYLKNAHTAEYGNRRQLVLEFSIRYWLLS